MSGNIRVTVQTEDRIQAITTLARAVNTLAEALSVAPEVIIDGCDIGSITVDTSDDGMGTLIEEFE